MFAAAVITPPAPVVSLAAAKAHLNVFHDEDDVLIEACVAAATDWLDGPTGWLNRSVGVQVLQLSIDGFPDEPLELPLGPVTSIDDITYIDADGVRTPIDPPDIYELDDAGRLVLAYGQSWPTTRSAGETVRILYTAGFETLPPKLHQAILVMTADMYANRETGGVGTVAFEFKMPTTAEALCHPYRVWRS